MGTEHFAIEAYFAAEFGAGHRDFDNLFAHGASVVDGGTRSSGLLRLKLGDKRRNISISTLPTPIKA